MEREDLLDAVFGVTWPSDLPLLHKGKAGEALAAWEAEILKRNQERLENEKPRTGRGRRFS